MALEATPIIIPSDNDVECSDLDLITETIEFMDDCPVMPKLNAFLSARGQCSTLEKVFKNRTLKDYISRNLTPTQVKKRREMLEVFD